MGQAGGLEPGTAEGKKSPAHRARGRSGGVLQGLAFPPAQEGPEGFLVVFLGDAGEGLLRGFPFHAGNLLFLGLLVAAGHFPGKINHVL